MASSPDEDATTKFLEAVFYGNLQLLKRLVSELDSGDGSAISVADFKDHGRTALHAAAATGQTHVCKYLIEELKFDVNMKDEQGEGPLHHATLQEHLPTATYLLEKGANPTAENNWRITALHFAATKGCKKLLRLLISKGAVVEAEAYLGTPLHWASANGKKEAVKILLENNANANKVFDRILPPLVMSIYAKSVECVKLLLKAGADPNTNPCKATPLELAVIGGETEIIKCLLKAGANPNVVNSCGFTPIEVAAMLGNHKDLTILLPVTSQISTIPEWSCGGIVKYVHSNESQREEGEIKRKECFSFSKSKGDEAFKGMDYLNAIHWYSKTIYTDNTDAALFSNRSLCWARLNEGNHALSDALSCIALRPDWPKAYYREGVAWNLLEQYHQASESFNAGLKLDPENKELQTAFREAVQAKFTDMCLAQER